MGVKKVFGALAKVAPLAAAAMSGGALGPAAQGVVSAVGRALGKPGASPEECEKAVADASPEQFVELRRIEADLAKEQAELDYKREELGYKRVVVAAKDRDSARKREAAVKDSTPKILSFLITGALMAVILILMLRGAQIDTAVSHVLSVLVGYLGAGFQTMLSYYFGSSAGSAEKNEHLRAAFDSKGSTP